MNDQVRLHEHFAAAPRCLWTMWPSRNEGSFRANQAPASTLPHVLSLIWSRTGPRPGLNGAVFMLIDPRPAKVWLIRYPHQLICGRRLGCLFHGKMVPLGIPSFLKVDHPSKPSMFFLWAQIVNLPVAVQPSPTLS